MGREATASSPSKSKLLCVAASSSAPPTATRHQVFIGQQAATRFRPYQAERTPGSGQYSTVNYSQCLLFLDA